MLSLSLFAFGCATTEKPVLRPVTNAAPPIPPGVYDVSKVDVRPIPMFQAPLRYPAELKGAGIAGVGVVSFIVESNGAIGDAVVVSATDARFGDAAVEAILKWRFRPAWLNGTFVRCHMTMPIKFTNPGDVGISDHAAVAAAVRELQIESAKISAETAREPK
jgi:protein TonB